MAGFRKSVLGFNRDDVLEYIKNAQAEYSEKLLNKNRELENAQHEILELVSKNAKLEDELSKYTAKQEEIDRLSHSIAKMHIVANANARAVLEKSAESVAVSSQQASSNLQCAQEATAALTDIRGKLTSCCAEFCEKVDSLFVSLEEVKYNITENSRISEDKIKEFREMFNKVNNA